ncbi:bifunctional diguanylate cyclase/phosphodiesterase [Beggiatoa leptomitoformis]|uniref:bifunctional diguanylate cyclase/phosphodiesterase n=1 Tax=Beggiatoa leptomitoformis TaxID=288004 RepID=UPI0013759350|nr:EAL domain-containing protein [Beggiatoa leptomitoformis]
MLKKSYLTLIFVAILGCGLSFFAFNHTQKWEEQQVMQEKEALLDHYIRLLRQASLTVDQLLGSLRGLYSIKQKIEHEDFALLVNQELLTDWIVGFTWSPYIKEGQRAEIEQQLTTSFWQYNNQQQAVITPTQVDYYPILFAEPKERFKTLIGFDVNTVYSFNFLHSSSVLLSFQMPHGAEKQLHVFLPIYTEALKPIGFFTAILQLNTFIDVLLRPAKQRYEVFLVIRDTRSPNPQNIIYAPDWYAQDKTLQNEKNTILSVPIEFEGQQWRIELHHLLAGTSIYYAYAWMVLFMGILFTIGLTRYLYVVLNHSAQTEILVSQRTQKLIAVNQTLHEEMLVREQMTTALIAAEQKFRAIFENAIEGIFQCTPDGDFLSINPAFARLFDLPQAVNGDTQVHYRKNNFFLHPSDYNEYIIHLTQQGEVKDYEYQAICITKQIVWVSETTKAVYNATGELQHYEGIIENITERKKQEEELRYAASHDLLTGLYNRNAFTERLAYVLQQQQDKFSAANHIPFAVLFIDLDRFKIVNDSMGHLMGDKLLKQMAERLATTIQQFTAMIARFGGDEFALLIEEIPDLETLETYIEQVQQQLNQPYELEGEIFITTASIGIALSASHYTCPNEILRDADTAMYAAKKQGLGKYAFFQQGMHTHIVHIMRMESDLRKAFERNELCIYYQPIIALEKQHTVGLEALIRWQHPQRGLISPDEFIPLAEETGLIQELGRWVFSTACVQLYQWQQRYPQHANLGININVSPIQFKQPRLVREIQDIIERAGISPRSCRLEITESAMMYNPEETLKTLQELKELEVQLYIDDFGTGYSSLSYLQKFPIDALKIDKSFIRDLENDPRSHQIAQAIIALGEAFNLKTIAEGVETQQQLSILKMAGCHHVQGFLFSRPRPLSDIEQYLCAETKYDII